MNLSAIAAIIDPSIQLVAVEFTEAGKWYTFKAKDLDLKIGDKVVVDTYDCCYKIATVMDDVAIVNFEGDIKYKWAIAKVDLNKHKEVLAWEKEIVDAGRRNMMEQKRKQLRAEFEETFGDMFSVENALEHQKEEEKVDEKSEGYE